MTGRAMVVVLVGLIAGELADLVMKRRGYGLGGDVLFGIAGSLAGGALFNIFATMPGQEWLAMVAAALTGAVVVIAAQRMFWQAHT